jgi:hypothetical protein
MKLTPFGFLPGRNRPGCGGFGLMMGSPSSSIGTKVRAKRARPTKVSTTILPSVVSERLVTHLRPSGSSALLRRLPLFRSVEGGGPVPPWPDGLLLLPPWPGEVGRDADGDVAVDEEAAVPEDRRRLPGEGPPRRPAVVT